MDFAWGPFLSFIFVVSFTPGPNNLTAAAMGMKSGFKQTLPFAFGVYTGMVILLILVGFLKIAVNEFFQRYQTVFKIAGSAYLLWLAFSLLKTSDSEAGNRHDVSFLKGVVLQLVNPKGLLFAVTLYALFLTTSATWKITVMQATAIPLVSLISVATWGYAGSYISKYMKNPVHRRIFLWTCAVLLVYTVVTILTHQIPLSG
jgi:cysteine/O-acetylserine efflux protein